MLSLLTEEKLRRVLARMLDPAEFFGGLRHPLDLADHLDHPYTFYANGRPLHGVVPAGRVGQRDVRRQLELAWAHLGARQRHDRPSAAADVRLSTATTSRSSVRPARGRYDDALSGGPGAAATALNAIFLRDKEGRRPGLRRLAQVPERPALAGPHPVLRILPRRQRRRPRRQPPDRLDRGHPGPESADGPVAPGDDPGPRHSPWKRLDTRNVNVRAPSACRRSALSPRFSRCAAQASGPIILIVAFSL